MGLNHERQVSNDDCVSWCGIVCTLWEENKSKMTNANKTAFTIGHTKNYDEALTNGERNKLGKTEDYSGGWIWKSGEEAANFIKNRLKTVVPQWNPDNFSVYVLALPTGWDEDVSVEPGNDGIYNLINDATIVKKYMTDNEFYGALPGMSKCSKCGGWYDTYVLHDIFHECEYPKKTLITSLLKKKNNAR